MIKFRIDPMQNLPSIAHRMGRKENYANFGYVPIPVMCRFRLKIRGEKRFPSPSARFGNMYFLIKIAMIHGDRCRGGLPYWNWAG
jgi:hypothetical protein